MEIKYLKTKKGVTMVSLIITIVLMVIIAGIVLTISLNSSKKTIKDTVKLKNKMLEKNIDEIIKSETLKMMESANREIDLTEMVVILAFQGEHITEQINELVEKGKRTQIRMENPEEVLIEMFGDISSGEEGLPKVIYKKNIRDILGE